MPTSIVATSATDLQPPAGTRALLFDWDGTLFNNHHFNFLVLQEALATFGITITENWFHENSGFSARHIIELAAVGQGVSIPAGDVIDSRNRIANDRIHEVPRVEELHELIGLNQDKQLGIVTGSERSSIEPLLALHQLDTIDVIVARDDIKQGKPSPEGYQLALKMLGVQPSWAVAYEDSDQGVEAALAAGLNVVDVRRLSLPCAEAGAQSSAGPERAP